MNSSSMHFIAIWYVDNRIHNWQKACNNFSIPGEPDRVNAYVKYASNNKM